MELFLILTLFVTNNISWQKYITMWVAIYLDQAADKAPGSVYI